MLTLKEFYRTGIYEVDHSTFGGEIYFTDFCTDYRGNNEKESPIAKRIISDWKFDKACERNIKNRNMEVKKNNA